MHNRKSKFDYTILVIIFMIMITAAVIATFPNGSTQSDEINNQIANVPLDEAEIKAIPEGDLNTPVIVPLQTIFDKNELEQLIFAKINRVRENNNGYPKPGQLNWNEKLALAARSKAEQFAKGLPDTDLSEDFKNAGITATISGVTIVPLDASQNYSQCTPFSDINGFVQCWIWMAAINDNPVWDGKVSKYYPQNQVPNLTDPRFHESGVGIVNIGTKYFVVVFFR